MLMKAAERLAETSRMALTLGKKFLVFYIECCALFQVGVRPVSFFRGTQI